jgi:hypothetical protein
MYENFSNILSSFLRIWLANVTYKNVLEKDYYEYSRTLPLLMFRNRLLQLKLVNKKYVE